MRPCVTLVQKPKSPGERPLRHAPNWVVGVTCLTWTRRLPATHKADPPGGGGNDVTRQHRNTSDELEDQDERKRKETKRRNDEQKWENDESVGKYKDAM